MSKPHDNLTSVEQILHLSFKDRGLLQLALTHSSYLNEHPDEVQESNERLEFLGDAFIDVVVGEELYKKFPDLDEGALSHLRSTIVREESLANAARRIRLGQYLRMGRGNKKSSERNRDSILSDAFEAVVGAVFLDQGYIVARVSLIELLYSELNHLSDMSLEKDAKSQLQEFALREGKSLKYNVVAEHGPGHQLEFTVHVVVGEQFMGSGVGRRKLEAETNAAKEALRAIS
ncbi:MAG: ribonuclease III [SAR202 cluster bacterium Io17-Chloro-G3]|nr:MAG: ribonuclease III [SAR202 cluster bacterium Io17-Chloro-G3]